MIVPIALAARTVIGFDLLRKRPRSLDRSHMVFVIWLFIVSHYKMKPSLECVIRKHKSSYLLHMFRCHSRNKDSILLEFRGNTTFSVLHRENRSAKRITLLDWAVMYKIFSMLCKIYSFGEISNKQFL